MDDFERIVNEEKPSEKEIIKTIGKNISPFWNEVIKYVKDSYNITPKLIFGGKKYGWCYKFRKSIKTLCTLFPEKNAFTVLITLGRYDIERLEYNSLSDYAKKIFETTKQYHDGRWLWIRILNSKSVNDVKILLAAKRKPLLR